MIIGEKPLDAFIDSPRPWGCLEMNSDLQSSKLDFGMSGKKTRHPPAALKAAKGLKTAAFNSSAILVTSFL